MPLIISVNWHLSLQNMYDAVVLRLLILHFRNTMLCVSSSSSCQREVGNFLRRLKNDKLSEQDICLETPFNPNAIALVSWPVGYSLAYYQNYSGHHKKNKLYPNQIMATPIQCNVHHRHTIYFYRDYFDMLRAVGTYDMKRGSYLEIVPMHHHSSSAFLAIEFFL